MENERDKVVVVVLVIVLGAGVKMDQEVGKRLSRMQKPKNIYKDS